MTRRDGRHVQEGEDALKHPASGSIAKYVCFIEDEKSESVEDIPSVRPQEIRQTFGRHDVDTGSRLTVCGVIGGIHERVRFDIPQSLP
jgi:hypothetical protein